jgi:competence protein ComEC
MLHTPPDRGAFQEERRMFERIRSWLARVDARLPALTPARALAVLAGAVAVQALPELPVTTLMPFVLAAACIAVMFACSDRMLVWFVIGVAWTVIRADAYLEARLPERWHGRDFVVSGVVSGLPQVEARGTRFDFRIESAQLDGATVDLAGPVRLTWYDDAPPLAPCSRWTLTLRLRPPRGLLNPGASDSERNAAQQGRIAVGYVRAASSNRAWSEETPCVDRWRAAIAQTIAGAARDDSAGPLLRALAVGDQAGIGEHDWNVLRATGIGHLISISGLHVGLFAAFGAWLARRVWKCVPRVTLRVPAPLIEAPAAMACAFAYGLLAGMGLPTVRTLLMIAVALLARLARRATTLPQALGLAALAILLWDPLAVLAAGFWLSFVGVAILLAVTVPVGDERPAWRDLPRVQWMLSLALLPLTVWFFGQASLVGPLANLVAVPWISFVVVPVTVAAGILLEPAPAFGLPLLHLAEVLLLPLWWLMEWMAAWPIAQHWFVAAPTWTFVLAGVGIAVSLVPRGLPLRFCALLLVLPMLVPARDALGEGEFEVWMLDVGQGLSVLVRTRDHALLYDAGARHSTGFDVGEAVVVPALRALGVDTLDHFVVSHGDNDHAGGAAAVHLAYPYAVVMAGEPARLGFAARACVAGDAWRRDGVDFRVLWPTNASGSSGNDRSCVLLIGSAHGSLVLTGDVSARIERTIATALGSSARPLLASVAHHGSATASSAAWLDVAAPDQAWISAGHRNRFGHPHADVVERHRVRGIALADTAASGCLALRFAPDRPPRSRACRAERRAWWRIP